MTDMFCDDAYLINKKQACDICGKNNYLLMFFSFLVLFLLQQWFQL